MSEEPVDAVLGRGELGVVEIVGMDGDAIGEGCETGRRLQCGAKYCGGTAEHPKIGEVAAHDLPRSGPFASNRQSDRVEDVHFAEFDEFGGKVFEPGVRDEFRSLGGHAPCRSARSLLLSLCPWLRRGAALPGSPPKRHRARAERKAPSEKMLAVHLLSLR